MLNILILLKGFILKKLNIFFTLFILFSSSTFAIQEEACDSLDSRSSNSNLNCLYFDSVNFNSNNPEDITSLLSDVLTTYNQIIFPARNFIISNTITIPRGSLNTKVSFRGTNENGNSTKLIAGVELQGKFMFDTPPPGESIAGDKGLIIEGITFENNQCTSDSENKNNCGILKYIGNGARISNNSFISKNGICIKHDSQKGSRAPGYNNRIMDNIFECELPFYAPLVDDCTEREPNTNPFCSLPTDQFFINNKMKCGDNCINASGLSGTQFINNEFISGKFAITNTGLDSWISMHKNKYSEGGLFQLKYYTDKIEEKFTYPINKNLSDTAEQHSYIIIDNELIDELTTNKDNELSEYSNLYNFQDNSTLCYKLSVCEEDLSKRFKSIISYANNTKEPISIYFPDNSNGTYDNKIDNTESEALNSKLTIVGSGSSLSSIFLKAPLKVSSGGELVIENLTLRGLGDSVLDITNSSLSLLHVRIGKYEGSCIKLNDSTNVSIKRSEFYNCNVGIDGKFDDVEPKIEIVESIISSLSTQDLGPREVKSFLSVKYENSMPSGKIKVINNHMWGSPTSFFFDIKNVEEIVFEGNDFENLGSKGVCFKEDSCSDNKVKLLSLFDGSSVSFNHNIFRVEKDSDEVYTKEYLINSGGSKVQFLGNVFNIKAKHDSIGHLVDALDKIKIISFGFNKHDKIIFIEDSNKINWKTTNEKGVFNISTADNALLTFDAQEVKFSWDKENHATTYITELRTQYGKTESLTSGWDSQVIYDANELGNQPQITSKQSTGSSYQYRVKICYQDLLCSDWSESNVIYLLPPPKNVRAEVSNNKDITVRWDEVIGAASYERQSANSEYSWEWGYSKFYKYFEAKYENQKPRRSKYRVRSCNESGCSDWTNSEEVGIVPPPPESVNSWITTNLSDSTKHDVHVHWSWVQGAEYYEREVHTSYRGWWWNKYYTETSVTYPKYNSGLARYRVRACIRIEDGCSEWREQTYSIRIP